MAHIGCSWLEPALNPSLRKKTVKRIIETINVLVGSDKFDAIAFRGMSGALIAPAVAAKLRKNLIMVRKTDGSHSGYDMEGETNVANYIIVDDLIASGATVDAIIQKINSKRQIDKPEPKCIAIILFCDDKAAVGDYNGIPCYCFKIQ